MSNVDTNIGGCSKHGPLGICGHTDATCTDKKTEIKSAVPQPGESTGRTPLVEGVNMVDFDGKNEMKKKFADSLELTNFDARNIRLWKLKDDPSKLVREARAKEEQTLDELEKSIREGEILFAKMHDKYGIKVVSMKSTREKNKEGTESIFTVVDKIVGQNLSEIKELPEESKDELESLYLSLGQHYYDSYNQKLQYWGDGRSDQFVYGAKHGEEDKHFYLTDVDPEFYREGDDEWHTIEAALGSVCHDLVDNENKFKPKVRFQAARDGLLSIVNEMLGENPDWKMLAEAKGWLEN